MSERLNNICVEYGFDDKFKGLLMNVEVQYNLLAQADGEMEQDMVSWIFNANEIEELSCLSEREKFIFGFSSLMSIIINY